MRVDNVIPVRDALLDTKTALELLDAVMAKVGAQCSSVRLSQVRYVPESSLTVRYQADVTWHNGDRSKETMVAMAGRKTPGDAVAVEIDGFNVAVWRYPNDPFLPGLAALYEPGALSQLLDQLDAPDHGVEARVRVYRPGRRAVLELAGPETRVFLKVVKPKRTRSLQENHQQIAGALPVPHSYGWSEELGLVAIQAIEGVTLRNAIERQQERRPKGSELFALVEALPELPGGSMVDGPVSRASDHATLISYVLPHLEERVAGLAKNLGSDSTPTTTVHGDFHASQILVDSNGITGLTDVDSAGIGDPADDMATMIAQISTLAIGPRRPQFALYGRSILNELERIFEPADLRRRVAASCLGFATGPFRVQLSDWQPETLRRIELAEEWLASADT